MNAIIFSFLFILQSPFMSVTAQTNNSSMSMPDLSSFWATITDAAKPVSPISRWQEKEWRKAALTVFNKHLSAQKTSAFFLWEYVVFLEDGYRAILATEYDIIAFKQGFEGENFVARTRKMPPELWIEINDFLRQKQYHLNEYSIASLPPTYNIISFRNAAPDAKWQTFFTGPISPRLLRGVPDLPERENRITMMEKLEKINKQLERILATPRDSQ